MKTRNVCVLGAGFIGKALIRRLGKEGFALSVLDHKAMPEGYDRFDIKWTQGSYHDSKKLSEALKGTEYVFHLIGNTVPGDCMDLTEELASNVTDSIRLLQECVQAGVKGILYMSSAAVYGIQKEMPIRETAVTNPISSYGINKLAIEKYLHYYEYQHGLRSKILRLSNPYGLGQNLYGRQGFIAMAIGRILEGQDVIVRGDGTTVRDYIHIDDVIDACLMMLEDCGGQSVYNIGSGIGASLNDITLLMKELMGEKVTVMHTESRSVDIPVSVLDIGRATYELGFRPKYDLRTGLNKTLCDLNIL